MRRPTCDTIRSMMRKQVGVVEECGLRLLDPAVAFDVELVVPVDHHLGDARVPEKRLQRPVAEDVIRDLPLELVRVRSG